MQSTTGALVDLLGDTRGQIVELLHERPRSVAELARQLGLSEVAIRRHLQVLEQDELVVAHTVRRSGPGRPGSRYELTERAARLFPDRSAAFAKELLEFVETEHGHETVEEFLRWRADQQRARYAQALPPETGDTGERAQRLAELLSEDGFESAVEAVTRPDGSATLRLTQGHCVIRDVAEQHPEVCAFETRMFEDLLGVRVHRRQTAAGGAGYCVCEMPAGPARKESAGDGGAGGQRRTGALDGDEG